MFRDTYYLRSILIMVTSVIRKLHLKMNDRFQRETDALLMPFKIKTIISSSYRTFRSVSIIDKLKIKCLIF